MKTILVITSFLFFGIMFYWFLCVNKYTNIIMSKSKKKNNNITILLSTDCLLIFYFYFLSSFNSLNFSTIYTKVLLVLCSITSVHGVHVLQKTTSFGSMETLSNWINLFMKRWFSYCIENVTFSDQYRKRCNSQLDYYL